MRSRASCSPFTLIELLVVIAIIAVLASLLLPALGEARNASRRAVCIGNNRELVLAMTSYASDFDGFMAKYDSGRGALSAGKYVTNYAHHPATLIQQNSQAEWYRRVVNHGIWMMDSYATPDIYFCPDVDFEQSGNNRTMAEQRAAYNGPVRELLLSGGERGYSGVQVYNYCGYGFNTILNEHNTWYASKMHNGTRPWRLGSCLPAFPVTFDWRTWSGTLYSAHDGKGYTVSYVDGSAAFLRTADIINRGIDIGNKVGGRMTYYKTYWSGYNVMPLNPRLDPDMGADGQCMNNLMISEAPTSGFRYARYGRITEIFFQLRN